VGAAFAGSRLSDVPAPPAGKADIVIRSREGNGLSVSQWTIHGKLRDGRPVVVTFHFSQTLKTIKVGLAVAGKSWGEYVIEEAKFPEIDVRSLGLNQFLEHVQVIFDYGPKEICPGGYGAEVVVDFTSKAVRLIDHPPLCP
jgi:hypothetical protein